MMDQQEIEELMSKMQKEADSKDSGKTTVKPVVFPPLTLTPQRQSIKSSLTHFEDIVLDIYAELGQAEMKIRDILNLEKGSIIELNKPAGESSSIYINNHPFAQGEVLVINDLFAVRLNKIIQPAKKCLKKNEEG